MKKDFLNQENPKTDKLEQIKRILATKESSDVKVYLINEVVNGSKSKGLAEIEIDKNTLSMAEEILWFDYNFIFISTGITFPNINSN